MVKEFLLNVFLLFIFTQASCPNEDTVDKCTVDEIVMDEISGSFASSIILQDSVVKSNGIRNQYNNCYISSVLQALYHLPSVRNFIMRHESNNIVHIGLNIFFYRLATGDGPQELSVEFLRIMQGIMKNDGAPFKIGSYNDVSEFWQWLMESIKTLQDRFFAIETHRWHEVVGINMLQKIQKENRVLVQVLANPDTSIDKLMVNPVQVNLNLYRRDLQQEYVMDDEDGSITILDKLSSLGVFDDKKDKKTVTCLQHTAFSSLPPILAIQASKFDDQHLKQGLSSIWRNDVTTIYPTKFTLNDQAYHLHAMIIYRKSHYMTRTCIDVATDTWALFDDSTVSPSSMNEPFREDEHPYWFFYVQHNVREQWKQAEFRKAPVSDKIAAMAQSIKASYDGLLHLAKLLRKNVKLDVLDIEPPPAAELFMEL